MYYIKEKNGVIENFAKKEDIESGLVKMDYTTLIDYEPIQYNGSCYTQEKFAEIEKTAEYIEEQLRIKKIDFDYKSKEMETDASYIEYKGKKIPLSEILFKSLVYTSVTDLYVYVKAEDGTLIKVLKSTFALLAAKAKSNLKAVEDALYDADNKYDPTKSLEENIAKIKGIFDAIDKIFND